MPDFDGDIAFEPRMRAKCSGVRRFSLRLCRRVRAEGPAATIRRTSSARFIAIAEKMWYRGAATHEKIRNGTMAAIPTPAHFPLRYSTFGAPDRASAMSGNLSPLISPSAKPYAAPFLSPNGTGVKCRPVPSLKNTACGPEV